MANIVTDEPDALWEQLRAEFERGIAVANDPMNEAAIREGGEAQINLRSPWLFRRCARCRHTFRLGDRVQVSPSGEAFHDMPELPCASDAAPVYQVLEEAMEFFEGMDTTWPPPVATPVVCLEPGHPLLAPPFAGLRRRNCVVCAHTFRAGDLVVICPCSPTAPLCMGAVHRDPVHNLSCLEAWNPETGRRTYCPIMSRRLDG